MDSWQAVEIAACVAHIDWRALFGNTGSMTERDRWGLRGPVHIFRLQRTWYSRRCGADACETEERSDTTTLEFRPDGSLARRLQHNPDGSEWTATHEYDETGKLTTVRTESGTGSVDLRFHEYDNAGRLARIIDRPNTGVDRISESYEYDADGRRKKTLYVDLTAQRPNTRYAWAVEGSDSIYSAPGASTVATVTTLYNKLEQPTDFLFHDEAGGLLSRVEFAYDPDGKLIKEAQTTVAETLPPEMLSSLNQAQLAAVRTIFGAAGEPVRRLHRYDEQGRRAETRWQMGPLGGDSKTMAYNDHGDPSEEVCEHDHRDHSIDDEGRLSDAPVRQSVSRSEARFHYDYDAHGNWVTKTVESRSGADHGFTLSSVERRTISYLE